MQDFNQIKMIVALNFQINLCGSLKDVLVEFPCRLNKGDMFFIDDILEFIPIVKREKYKLKLYEIYRDDTLLECETPFFEIINSKITQIVWLKIKESE